MQKTSENTYLIFNIKHSEKIMFCDSIYPEIFYTNYYQSYSKTSNKDSIVCTHNADIHAGRLLVTHYTCMAVHTATYDPYDASHYRSRQLVTYFI